MLDLDNLLNSIYLESLENNSNDNDYDDSDDDDDNNKTVQLVVVQSNQPSERAGEPHTSSQKQRCEKNTTNQAREQASRTRPRRNNDVKKIQQQQLPSTRRVQDSP